MTIVSDEDVLHGLPRLTGTRISVLHVYDMVVDGDGEPAAVADALDIEIGEVYEALAYYYNHPDEIRRFRAAQESALQEARERTVKPPVEADGT